MNNKVISVTELDDSDEDVESDILDVKIVAINDLDDSQLEEIFINNPEWVYEHRPYWVKQHHPEFIN